MKGLLSTAASRAWLAVFAVGIVVIVLGVLLVPRLGAGQDVVDAARPVMTDSSVAGEVGGAKLLSQYVELADPLVTKGGAAREVDTLVTMIAHKTGVSRERARAFLTRTAPHTEALLRALPFSGIERERGSLTSFLATTLNTTQDDVQEQFAQTFPRLFQMLSELASVTGGWRTIPGVAGLTRLDGTTPVKSVPDFSDYVRDDLTATVAGERDRFQALAGSGGIGYVPYLLLIVGAILAGFGMLHARWGMNHPAGKRAWGVVVAIGVLVMIVVGALQYFPRLNGARTTVSRLQPAFDAQRAAGTRAGADLVQHVARFGDPLMTPSGGGSAEVPQLVTYISERAGLTAKQVRGRLRQAAPKTSGLLDAMPLTSVAGEIPNLLLVLAHKLGRSRDELDALLRRRTPQIAQALHAVGPVTAGWNSIPGSQGFERFDGATPVRTLPAYADYLDEDVVPVLETQRARIDRFAGTWPPLQLLPAIVLAIGALLAIYGTAMMFLVTKAPPRY